MAENRYKLNKELAKMLKGGVIMDVTTPEQAKIAEAAGACAVMALDMCGAVAMKRHFPTAIIFIDKDKEELIHNVVEDDFSAEEKTLRILSIDAEKRNQEICDYTINNRQNDGVKEILRLLS